VADAYAASVASRAIQPPIVDFRETNGAGGGGTERTLQHAAAAALVASIERCSEPIQNGRGPAEIWNGSALEGTHTRTHPFNGPLSGNTRESQYQKGETNLDFAEARDSEWQWHQLGRMQVCTSLQTDNHSSTPPLSFYRPDALPAVQPTVSKHRRHGREQV